MSAIFKMLIVNLGHFWSFCLETIDAGSFCPETVDAVCQSLLMFCYYPDFRTLNFAGCCLQITMESSVVVS